MSLTQWYSVDSLTLNGSEWKMTNHQLPKGCCSDVHPLIECGSDRNVHSFKIGGDDKHARVLIQQKRDRPAGCRSVAEAFVRVAERYGGLDRVPAAIYFESSASFLPRALSTLKFMAQAEHRVAIQHASTIRRIPTLDVETWQEYEHRAVGECSSMYPDFETCGTDTIRLAGIQSKPDGILINRDRRELITVGAMKRKLDFVEGMSQVIQYYSQHQFSPRFKGWKFSATVVTSEVENASGYSFWEKLVSSPRNFSFVVKM